MLLLDGGPDARAAVPDVTVPPSVAAPPAAVRAVPAKPSARAQNAAPRNAKTAAGNASGTRSLPGRMPRLAPAAGLPNGFEPAPTPNPDLYAPTVRGPTETRLGATLTRRAEGFGSRGDGFSPGSSYNGYFDRRGRAVEGIGSTLAPSFQLRVPLE